jgi:hypothetical protein
MGKYKEQHGTIVCCILHAALRIWSRSSPTNVGRAETMITKKYP